jgi:transitional endoplasmic reticulum ATPase
MSSFFPIVRMEAPKECTQLTLLFTRTIENPHHHIQHAGRDTIDEWKRAIQTIPRIQIQQTILFTSIHPHTGTILKQFGLTVIQVNHSEVEEELPLCPSVDIKFQRVPISNGFEFEKIEFALYQKEAAVLREEIHSRLFLRSTTHSLGLGQSRGIYIVGPKGYGKRSMVNHVVTEMLLLPLFYFNLFEESAYRRHQKHRGRDIKATPLSNLLEEMPDQSVLLLDGLELLADYKWKEIDISEFVQETVNILKAIRGDICIVATCVGQDVLPRPFMVSFEETALFGTQIEISSPNFDQRATFLKMHLGYEYPWISQIVNQTVGFSIRDLYLICRERKMLSVVEHLDSLSLDGSFSEMKSIIRNRKTAVESNGFESVKFDVSFEQVGGYHDIKKELERFVLWPILKPEQFELFQVTPPKGLLLYGPSGCGKTFLVHAFASQAPCHFISVKCHQIYSKYLGESEQKIRLLFETCRKSRPCILFFDGMDALGTRREWTEDGTSGVQERVLSTLLNELDGVSELTGVFVIACTNHPEKLDDALKRPGRLDTHILVDRPSLQERKEILEIISKNSKLGLLADDLDWLASETNEFTCADLVQLVREAGMIALSEDMGTSCIQFQHILEALQVSLAPDGWWRPQGLNL